MPFLFKLSRRWARLRVIVLVGTLAVGACEFGRLLTGVDVVDRLVLSPSAVTVQPNQTVDFTAVGFTSTFDTAAMRVTWSVTGGSITDKGSLNGRHLGQYKNGTCGAFKVTATSQPGSKSDTADVSITCVAVASVAVSPAQASIEAGQTVQLTATPKDANGNTLTGRVITWASGNTAAATVTSSGLVRGVAAGSATITATSEGRSGTSAITVTPIPVASVAVSPAQASVEAGQTVQLTATPKDANGNALSGRAITWTSGNTAVATVSASGLVSGVGAGSVTITATSEGQSGTSAITVTPIPVPVASVAVSPAQASVDAGQTVQLTATPRDANGNALTGRAITWTSGNTAAATVTSSGLVRGVAAGSATITATSEGQSGTSAITVVVPPPVPVASVTVSPTSGSVAVGAVLQLTATPKDANGNSLSGRVITWTSGNTAAATVTSSGLVSGVAVGSATVTATSEGQSGTSAITVTPIPVASVAVSPAQASVEAGQTVQLTATPRDANGNALTGRVITWTSGNTAAATVTSSGLVRGVAAGSATITATSEGRSGTSAITVTPIPVASVAVSPAQASVEAGQTVQLTATPRDANGNTLTGRVIAWSSGNTAAATVSSSGLVRGVAAGSATITATSEGRSGTSAITVTAIPVAAVTVSPAQASVEAGRTVQLTATPRDASGNALTGRVITWISGNTAAATVSGSGLVGGVAAGSATITAMSEGRSGSAAITVTTPPPPGSDVVFVGAGDIANCGTTYDEATAKLLDGIAGTVFTLGDNVYTNGTATEFATCYEPTWGRHKARTRPAPGNHDYNTSGAVPYYEYFGANAGPAGRGYYSYDLGDWHIVSLNSEVSTSAGSAQEQWLRADLAASSKQCTLAYWHKPRFSSGEHGSLSGTSPLWAALYDFNAELVLVGHDHNYERFAPQTAAGVADPVRGLRQIVVGTGGTDLRGVGSQITNSEVIDSDAHGVLKLTLRAGAYTWEFIPIAGDTFTDGGSGSCH